MLNQGLSTALNWLLKNNSIDLYDEDDADNGFDLNSDEDDDEVYEKKNIILINFTDFYQIMAFITNMEHMDLIQ